MCVSSSDRANGCPVLYVVYLSPYYLSVYLYLFTSSLQNKLRVEPKRGQWDMRHKQFHQGVEIHTWAILLFTEEKACDFDSLRWVGQRVGLTGPG